MLSAKLSHDMYSVSRSHKMCGATRTFGLEAAQGLCTATSTVAVGRSSGAVKKKSL
jgi:hypothetical protein